MVILENLEQWNILGKMEQWDTSTTVKEIGKDLIPYLDYVDDRLTITAYDNSIANELDTLKKILPRVDSLCRHFHVELVRPLEDAHDTMKELFLLPGHTNGKLKTVLMEQTELTNEQKNVILSAWERKSKFHWGCMPLDDSTLVEEYIRKNCAIISNCPSMDCPSMDEEGLGELEEFCLLVKRTKTMIAISFPMLTRHPDFKKYTTASKTLQLKRCSSTQVKRCKSTKHKRLKSPSSPKASQVKRCKSTKHKRLKSPSSPKASGQ